MFQWFSFAPLSSWEGEIVGRVVPDCHTTLLSGGGRQSFDDALKTLNGGTCPVGVTRGPSIVCNVVDFSPLRNLKTKILTIWLLLIANCYISASVTSASLVVLKNCVNSRPDNLWVICSGTQLGTFSLCDTCPVTLIGSPPPALELTNSLS